MKLWDGHTQWGARKRITREVRGTSGGKNDRLSFSSACQCLPQIGFQKIDRTCLYCSPGNLESGLSSAVEKRTDCLCDFHYSCLHLGPVISICSERLSQVTRSLLSAWFQLSRRLEQAGAGCPEHTQFWPLPFILTLFAAMPCAFLCPSFHPSCSLTWVSSSLV